MNFNEYQNLAERTAGKMSDEKRLANFAMGVAGEAGEVCDYLKKVLFHGHELDKSVLEKELGDVLWYIATLANTVDLDMEDIAIKNIAKLKKRYPEGFSSEDSINRED